MPVYEGIGVINEKHPVVLEFGQNFTKAGFAGDYSPRIIVPSTVPPLLPTSSFNGEETPTTKRLVDYADASDLYQMFVEFLHFLYFKHLLVTPKERRVVIVESLFAKSEWRQTLAKVLYLHYEVLSVLWIPNSVSSLCSTGNDTALLIDFGAEEVQVIPVFRGVTILNAVVAHELGAKAFDKNLKSILMQNCLSKPKDIPLESLLTDRVVEDIRVRCCFVPNLSRAIKLSESTAEDSSEPVTPKLKPFTYELDSGNFLTFDGSVREKAAEIWFQNDDLDGIALPVMVLDALSRCPIDTRRTLASSILITGGTGMIPGLKQRLVRELKTLDSSISRLEVSRDEKFAEKFGKGIYEFKTFNPLIKENCIAWMGGSFYGASDALSLRGVTKEFFLKHGVVPDWCNLAIDMVSGLSSSGISAYGSSSSLAKGL